MSSAWVYIDPFTARYNEGSLLIATVMSGLVLYPPIFWLVNGWAWKENDILVSLSNGAKNEYLKAFQRELDEPSSAPRRFALFYKRWYGRRHYLFPALILFVIAFYHAVSLAETAEYYLFADAADRGSFVKIPTISAAAFAGAYTFVAWDLTRRTARRNLSSDDIATGALRLAICVPMGHAFAGLAQDGLQPFIAFAIGVFPVGVLASILRRLANQQLHLDSQPDAKLDQVVKLSGVDASVVERLAETDITTIAQLAYCDPIQLAMRSNLNFAYLLDIVSQALAWVYLEDKLNALRAFGLRGACEIAAFRAELQAPDAAVRGRAGTVLALAASATGIDPAGLDYAFGEIALDPRTAFLASVAADPPSAR